MKKEKESDRKKIIAIFFGGCSTEYEVSLQSAYSVIQGISRDKYKLVLVGIDRHSGQWFWFRGETDKIEKDSWQAEEDCIPVFPSVDKKIHGLCYLDGDKLQTISLDAALPVLHGKNGEDGRLQGTLELMGIRVLGCGLLSSALCMDKEFAHAIARNAGIKTADSFTLYKDHFCTTGINITENGSTTDSEGFDSEIIRKNIEEQAEKIGYPLFVKPIRSGSSFGITKVSCKEELFPAIKNAFLHDDMVMLEETVPGFEVGCAVLGTEQLLLGEVDEIELSQGFFDYTEKYTLKTSNIHVPARITEAKAREIKETAQTLYKLLHCSGFARVDMFLTPEGEIFFNEVNTIPGFTSHSRYPNMLKAAGMSFEEIIEQILEG